MVSSSTFTAQASGAPGAPFIATLEDASGNATTSGSPVTINLSSNSGGTYEFAATSGGTSVTSVTLPANTQSVTAYYGDSKVGTPTITVSSTGLSSATQGETITAGAAYQLVVTTQPPASASGGTKFPVGVTVEDAFGNVAVTSAAPVTLAIATNPAAGSLSCTANPENASSGVATFSCSVDKVGSGYTLAATATGLTSTITNNFSITPAPAASVALTVTPSSATVSATTNMALSLQLQDAFGNNTTSSGTTTLTLSTPSAQDFFATTNGASGTLGGTINVTFANGVGTATAYYGDEKAETQTISALNGASTWGTATATTTPGTATKFDITAPVNGPASASATLGPITVAIEDSFGNATTSGSAITANLASNSSGTKEFSATSGGAAITSVSIPSGSSSAAIYYGDTKVGTPTLTASSTLTSDTQVETITPAAGRLGRPDGDPAVGHGERHHQHGPEPPAPRRFREQHHQQWHDHADLEHPVG